MCHATRFEAKSRRWNDRRVSSLFSNVVYGVGPKHGMGFFVIRSWCIPRSTLYTIDCVTLHIPAGLYLCLCCVQPAGYWVVHTVDGTVFSCLLANQAFSRERREGLYRRESNLVLSGLLLFLFIFLTRTQSFFRLSTIINSLARRSIPVSLTEQPSWDYECVVLSGVHAHYWVTRLKKNAFEPM